MRIAVIGLGKLGSPLAAVMAAKGHDVIGVDQNPDFVAAIQAGRAPVREPQLDEMIAAGRERLTAMLDCVAAVTASEITFIVVPTPSAPSGGFSLRYVLEAIESVGAALRDRREPHMVVVTSTVMPGATGGEIAPALARASGRVIGQNVGLCYNPEFIALGSVVRDMLHPDFVLIGESDPHSGAKLEELYRTVIGSKPRVVRMNFINAEITKISVNTFVTTKISYANMIADVCDRLTGADADVVTGALGLDARIGGRYLKGALGYGGPCFPRDNRAFARLARNVGALPVLAEATDEINRHQSVRLSALVERYLQPDARVAVLGLSYKPDTSVIEESASIELARRLTAHGYAVTVHDPRAIEQSRAVLRGSVRYAETAASAVSGADVVVLATAWPEYTALDPTLFVRPAGRRAVVIDCWRVLPREALHEVCDIVYLGNGDNPAPAADSATAVG